MLSIFGQRIALIAAWGAWHVSADTFQRVITSSLIELKFDRVFCWL